MAARPVASGTVSFGLVAVPVKLYPATKAKNLSFNLLHSKDKARLRQQYLCTACDAVVERDDMVRGYEFAKGEYAVLTDEELQSLNQKSDQSIEIDEFVPIEKVDPVYFEKSYLLGPDKGGHKPYHLLAQAMGRAGKCAVAKYSTRGRQQLVLIRQAGEGLIMHTLFYHDEVRSFEDVELGEAIPTKPVEVDLAVKLIDQLAVDSFDPSKYEDEYRKAGLAMIEQKIEGKEIAVAPARAPRAQVIDLMEALRASLAGTKTKRPPAADAGASDRAERAAVTARKPPAREGGRVATARSKPKAKAR